MFSSILVQSVVPSLFGTRDWVPWKTLFPWGGGGDGLGIIQVCYIYGELYFFYCISSTSDHLALDPGGWGPLYYPPASVPHPQVLTTKNVSRLHQMSLTQQKCPHLGNLRCQGKYPLRSMSFLFLSLNLC